MKKGWMIFLTSLIVACGAKDSETAVERNVLENLSYTVDTVVVDSGEELLNLQYGLGLADFSEDFRKLYLLSGSDQTLTEIDLDALKLVSTTKFEKEGPNGISPYAGKFQLLSDGSYLISGFQVTAIFNSKAEKIRDLKFLEGKIDSLSKEEERGAYFGLLATKDLKHFLSLPGNFFKGTRELLVADFDSLNGKVIKIPAMDITSELRIVLKSKEAMMVATENMEIQDLNDIAVISSSATSDLYLYDYGRDSLRLVNYTHTLVPGKKEALAKQEVESQEEFQKEWAKLQDQISFKAFVWDDKSKRYYRFGSINLPKSDPEAEQKAAVFLFAYDADFKLVGEVKVTGLSSSPAYPFFKDGKLWSYVNVDDELGFAVFTFDFQ